MVDAFDLVLGRRSELTPPRRLMFVGGGDFRTIGNEFLAYLKQLAELQPDHRVLEAGCGIGRMAVPLLGYLSDKGSYEGFDVVRHGIQWCSKHITTKYPNFRFQLADIRNKEYNPEGQLTASRYRFPYESSSFDVAFLTSVFTHMLPVEVSNYLTEVHRVLKPGGRCLLLGFS
jgi:ubiquinone/menaquinone biosynthesis C-methylase UbiE